MAGYNMLVLCLQTTFYLTTQLVRILPYHEALTKNALYLMTQEAEMYYKESAVCLLIVFILMVSVDQASAGEHYTNSIGMKMIQVQRGHFVMGREKGGDWDERPVHKVTITKPFYMSETEVTVEQFRQFRPNFTGIKKHEPYVERFV